MNRILSILSYVGMALVFGALAVRMLKPEWNQYAVYASWTGLALVLIYTLGQWREIVAYFRRRNARYGAIASVSVLVGARHSCRRELSLGEAEQALGPDVATSSTRCPTRRSSCCEVSSLRSSSSSSRSRRNVGTLQAAAGRIPVPVEAGERRVHRPRQETDPGQGVRDPDLRHGGGRIHGPQGACDQAVQPNRI